MVVWLRYVALGRDVQTAGLYSCGVPDLRSDQVGYDETSRGAGKKTPTDPHNQVALLHQKVRGCFSEAD